MLNLDQSHRFESAVCSCSRGPLSCLPCQDLSRKQQLNLFENRINNPNRALSPTTLREVHLLCVFRTRNCKLVGPSLNQDAKRINA